MADLRPLASRLPLTFNGQRPVPVSGIQRLSFPASRVMFVVCCGNKWISNSFVGNQPNYLHHGSCFRSCYFLICRVSQKHVLWISSKNLCSFLWGTALKIKMIEHWVSPSGWWQHNVCILFFLWLYKFPGKTFSHSFLSIVELFQQHPSHPHNVGKGPKTIISQAKAGTVACTVVILLVTGI